MANTFVLISTYSVGAGGISSVSFTNIPQTYTDLCLFVSGKDNRSDAKTDDYYILFNGGSLTSSYSTQRMYTESATVFADAAGTYSYSGFMSANQSGTPSTANIFGNAFSYFTDYTSTREKYWLSQSNAPYNQSSQFQIGFHRGRFGTSSPITSLQVIGQNGGLILQHSKMSLYGIKNS